MATIEELRALLAKANADLTPLLGSNKFSDAFLAKATANDQLRDAAVNALPALLDVAAAAKHHRRCHAKAVPDDESGSDLDDALAKLGSEEPMR